MYNLPEHCDRFSCAVSSQTLHDKEHQRQAAAALESILQKHNTSPQEHLSVEVYYASVWVSGSGFREYKLLDDYPIDEFTRLLLSREIRSGTKPE